jgi:truncated hemoglobin YjbI|tara:strand:- start:334 stop:603 length:270 start_codon:yes stop_codon:yes gene_type:complete
MKKIKRKKMINQLTDKHYDYIDRESQIKYIISKYYENMDKKDLAKCYRENIGKLHWPDIFVVHKGRWVEFMINPEKEISNPNQLMLFNI